jgi:predicted glutamine amidotransferase
MCVIIIREPGVTLDKVKWDSAVLNNPDGWGISVPDNHGQLLTIHSAVEEGEELYELLHTEYKDDKVLIHLRYTTAGETSVRNAHPFPVLEAGPDGVDMRMCHNGTLPLWTPGKMDLNQWESDTRCFVRGFVRPLMKRFIKGMDSEDILTDPFIDGLLDNQCTYASVLTFIDGYGNVSIVNEKGNGGFYDEDGTYFSNSYSHDPEHRLPYNKKTGYKPVGKTTPISGKTSGTGASVTNITTGKKTTFTDCSVGLFSDKHGIPEVSELYLLSDETITVLVEDEQDDAVLLIKELLAKSYQQSLEIKGLQQSVTRKDKEIKGLKDSRSKEKTHETT